jgi:hypothetical protein
MPKLGLALGVPEVALRDLAMRANSLYRKAKPIVKPDGSIRQPFDALKPLKDIQCLIKDRLLKKVDYPPYLTGSLKGRDNLFNANIHVGSKIVICEDIENFFPSTNRKIIKNIWLKLFKFSEDVAEVLTCLTTKDGAIPQGAVTSSYLANLVFWDCEPFLREKLHANGSAYSRYVDDITVSSTRGLSTSEKTHIIAQIYGMLARYGYKAKRRKHEIFTNGKRMITTKLIVNRKPAIPVQDRQKIRVAVHVLEERVASGERGAAIDTELNRVTSRAGRLGRFHYTESKPLKERIRKIRASQAVEYEIYTTR